MPTHGLILHEPAQALDLAPGRLAARLDDGLLIEVSFSPENVIAAAQLIVDAQDGMPFYTQAGVLAHAGAYYGWGMGAAYETV